MLALPPAASPSIEHVWLHDDSQSRAFVWAVQVLPRPIAGRTETNVMEYKSTRDQNQEQTKRLSAKAMITEHKDARGLPYFQSQLNAYINTNGGAFTHTTANRVQIECTDITARKLMHAS